METKVFHARAGIPRERRYALACELLLDAISVLPEEAEIPAELVRAAILAVSFELRTDTARERSFHPKPALPPEKKAPHLILGTLSKREMEIAGLVSVGRTNQQIARALGLSQKTVETYLTRTFRKLNVCSRSQIATLIGHARADSA